MKKLLLLSFIGLLLTGCSVEDENLVTGDTELLSSVDATYYVSDSEIHTRLCTDEINNPTLKGFTNYYRNQIFLNTDIQYITGTFNPSMAQLLEEYNQANGVGTFSTVYTAEGVELLISVEVRDCSIAVPVCANDIYDQLCSSQITNPTLNNFINYYRNLIFLNTDFENITGTFEPTLEDLYNEFNDAGRMGRFATNYTVDTEECGVITIEVAVEVIDCSAEDPVCASDIYVELCESQITNPTLSGFTNYYKNLIFLNTDFTTITGTFNPTMAELLEIYNQTEGLGIFATNYTVETEDCGVITFEVAVETISCN